MINGIDESTLLDSQKVVFKKAIQLAQRATENDQKHVLIVKGELSRKNGCYGEYHC
jgi:hypothetical protein